MATLNTRATAPIFTPPAGQIVGLASPSRGSSESSVWRVELSASGATPAHQLDREEIFVALRGSATFTIDGALVILSAGDTLCIPAGTPFDIMVGSDGLDAICVAPVGTQARFISGGEPFAPPWCV